MTSRDAMPFGKHKGKPLSDVPRSYFAWFFDQPDTKTKFADLYHWFVNGDASASAIEKSNLDAEAALLLGVTTRFREWWSRAYGERLRKSGELNYIPYLRVAIEAWAAAEKQLADHVTLPPDTPPARPTTPSIDSLIASPAPRPPPPVITDADRAAAVPSKITIHTGGIKPSDLPATEDVPF